MVGTDLKSQQQELSGRLQMLMLLRLLFVSILLGASVFIQIGQTKTYFGDIQTSHYLLIALIYFLTFIYLIIYKTYENFTGQAYLQLLVDTLFSTAIVYSTGGIESIFSFLYILTIINASIMLYRRGGMVVATSSSLLYGLLLDLHYYNIINPIGEKIGDYAVLQDVNIIYITVVNIGAFYLVAFLSSYPSERARRSEVKLKAKEYDIIKLEALNDWIISSMTSGLISLDGQDRIILFNPAAEEIFGVRAGDVIGLKITDAFPFLRKHVGGNIGEIREYTGAKHNIVDLEYTTGEGRKSYLRFFISPLKIPEGDRRGQILFFQDITEIRLIEEEMKRVEGLAITGELAAGIAHEIRNPMASISGSIQMLRDDLGESDVNRRLMDIMLREINRLNGLINDFLLFARPKPAVFRDINLKHLVQESVELFKNSAKGGMGIRILVDIREDITLSSDPDQIRQVLWNIFLNASEAMPDGGIVTVSGYLMENRPRTAEHGRGAVKIVVRDSGRGFTEDALSGMFTPFFTTKEGGTGLGLAIVNRIIGGLKGSVSGRNHPDGGAEITILLAKEI